MKTNLATAIARVCDANALPTADAWRACERAVEAAAVEVYGDAREFVASYDHESGDIRLELVLRVVDEVENPNTETTPSELAQVDVEAEHGETIGFPVWYLPKDRDQARVQDAQFGSFLGLTQGRAEFGRRAVEAARAALAAVFAASRRRAIFDAYSAAVGSVVVGRVRRVGRNGTAVVSLGDRVEAILPASEQSPRDKLTPGERIYAVVEQVSEVAGHPAVTLSRSSVGLVEALMPCIVPEIASGRVEVVRVAREAGLRTKIAVRTLRGSVDPIEASVGSGGSRVRELRQAIGGEQVDVFAWDDNPVEAAMSAMMVPSGIWFMEADRLIATVLPEAMAAAMGPRGVNVRLASELAGIEIEVKEMGQ